MEKKFKVVILNAPHPSFEIERELLQDIADIDVVWCESSEEIVKVVSDVDGLMVADIPVLLTEEMMEKSERLKVISVYGVGTDRIDVKAAERHGIVVTNAPDYGISEVADHTMALILSLIRKIHTFDKSFREVGWARLRKNVTQVHEIAGEIHRLSTMNLGLIGFGRIAKAVAKRAKGFGFHIMAYDPYLSQDSFYGTSVQKVDLDVLLREADIISIHTILTDETRHMVGENEINLMKKGVYLVNTSRGAIIDEKALTEAIVSRHIAAAALDVFEREPLQTDDLLLHMSNVILTPHIAWYSEESMENQKREVALDTRKVLIGEAPIYPVSL